LIVTDNKRPVIKVSRIEQRRTVDDVFGDWRGKVVYHGDVWKPVKGEWGKLV
jgi:hypothetical protein